MACGGFTCSKNSLAILNVLYLIVALVLISIAAYAKAVAVVSSISIVGGIIACGTFLLIISIIGLIGAIKHHQVLLFFYMIILFLLFLIQFAIACACLATNSDQQKAMLKMGWEKSSMSTKKDLQQSLECCGFENQHLPANDTYGYPKCENLACCKGKNAPCCTEDNNRNGSEKCPCTKTCMEVVTPKMNKWTKISGGVGLFFSFTEIIGVWLAVRYRNQKDPRANPSAFL